MPSKPRIVDEGIVYCNPHPGHKAIAAIYPSLVALSATDILCLHIRGQALYALDRRICAARSSDGGRTWDDAGAILPKPGAGSRPEDAEYCYNEPLVRRMRDGQLVVVALRRRAIESEFLEFNPATGGWRDNHMFIIRSGDDGRSWSPSEPLNLPGAPVAAAPSPPIELPNGQWFMSVEVWKRWDDPAPMRLVEYGALSSDRGATWSQRIEYPWLNRRDRCFSHCQYQPARDGGVIGSIWSHSIDSQQHFDLHLVRSDPTATHWEQPRPTGITGQVSCIGDAGGGVYGLLYTDRGHNAPGIRFVVSRDAGATWDVKNEVAVWDAVGAEYFGSVHPPKFPASLDNVAFGKPNLIVLHDGTFLCSWWCTHKGVIQVRSARVRLD